MKWILYRKKRQRKKYSNKLSTKVREGWKEILVGSTFKSQTVPEWVFQQIIIGAIVFYFLCFIYLKWKSKVVSRVLMGFKQSWEVWRSPKEALLGPKEFLTWQYNDHLWRPYSSSKLLFGLCRSFRSSFLSHQCLRLEVWLLNDRSWLLHFRCHYTFSFIRKAFGAIVFCL